MTREQSRNLYIAAGGWPDHSESQWGKIHKEMQAVVAATTEKDAAAIIDWWGCWRSEYTAIAFAQRVRANHALMQRP